MSAAGNDAGASPTLREIQVMQRRILSGLAALAAAAAAREPRRRDGLFVRRGRLRRHGLDGDGFDGTATASRCAGRWPCIELLRVRRLPDLSFDFNVDASLLEVGGGGHWPLSDKVDIVGKLASSRPSSTRTVRCGRRRLHVGARVRGVVARSSSSKAASIPRSGRGRRRDHDRAGRPVFLHRQLAGGLSVSIGDDVTSIGLNVAGRSARCRAEARPTVPVGSGFRPTPSLQI